MKYCKTKLSLNLNTVNSFFVRTTVFLILGPGAAAAAAGSRCRAQPSLPPPPQRRATLYLLAELTERSTVGRCFLDSWLRNWASSNKLLGANMCVNVQISTDCCCPLAAAAQRRDAVWTYFYRCSAAAVCHHTQWVQTHFGLVFYIYTPVLFDKQHMIKKRLVVRFWILYSRCLFLLLSYRDKMYGGCLRKYITFSYKFLGLHIHFFMVLLFRCTANVLSAESTDECLQTKSDFSLKNDVESNNFLLRKTRTK